MTSLFARPIRRPGLLGRVMLLVLLALAAGCASTPRLTFSGSLGDYSQLQIDSERTDSALWRKPDAPFANYKKVMIDMPYLYVDPKAGDRRLDPDLKNQLVEEMRAALTERLGAAYLVVKEPGPDTLRVRAAITNLMPTGKPSQGMTSAVMRVPVTFKESHMEAEALDSLTAERLLAIADSRRGRDLSTVTNEVKWEDVRSLMRDWSDALVRALAAH